MALALAILISVLIAALFSRTQNRRAVILVAIPVASAVAIGAFGVVHEVLIVGAPRGLSPGEYRVWCMHYFIGGSQIGLALGVITGTLAVLLVPRREVGQARPDDAGRRDECPNSVHHQ
jgi:hypothetical protein